MTTPTPQARISLEHSDTFKVEREYFDQIKQSLIEGGNLGRFAVVQGTTLQGCHDTYDLALRAGYTTYGLDTRFMVRKVEAVETIHSLHLAHTDSQINLPKIDRESAMALILLQRAS